MGLAAIIDDNTEIMALLMDFAVMYKIRTMNRLEPIQLDGLEVDENYEDHPSFLMLGRHDNTVIFYRQGVALLRAVTFLLRSVEQTQSTVESLLHVLIKC